MPDEEKKKTTALKYQSAIPIQPHNPEGNPTNAVL